MTEVWRARLLVRDLSFMCGWTVAGRAGCSGELATFQVTTVDDDDAHPVPGVAIPTFFVRIDSDPVRYVVAGVARDKIEHGRRGRPRRGVTLAMMDAYGFTRSEVGPVEIECLRNVSHGRSLIDRALLDEANLIYTSMPPPMRLDIRRKRR